MRGDTNLNTRHRWRLVALLSAGIALAACSSPLGSGRAVGTASAAPAGTDSAAPPGTPSAGGAILWDDFSEASTASLAAHGWVLRSVSGWPGVKGATFDSALISLVDDPSQPGNRLLQLSARTDGTTTHQSQICQQRKFLAGTYAARVFLTDAPSSGADGDQVVETFYLISPYVKPFDPSYSEVDNEYLPNGGWGASNPAFYVTTWHTVRIEPWSADNVSQMTPGSLQGWHTFVVQVERPETRYFLDGRLIAVHGERFYPRVAMSINFNLWMIDGGLRATGPRAYDEQVDWVFHQAGTILTPEQVQATVEQLRSSGTGFLDTVPSSGLESPCDL